MHTSSALIEELDDGVTLAEAEDRVLDLRPRALPRRQPAAAGRQHGGHRQGVPRPRHAQLEQFLHYRIVDVSSIKELSRRWFPRAYYNAPAKGGNHRALADIRESIEELRYYRDAVFVPPPGPDSSTAKRIAAQHGGSLTRRRPTRFGACLSRRRLSSVSPRSGRRAWWV